MWSLTVDTISSAYSPRPDRTKTSSGSAVVWPPDAAGHPARASTRWRSSCRLRSRSGNCADRDPTHTWPAARSEPATKATLTSCRPVTVAGTVRGKTYLGKHLSYSPLLLIRECYRCRRPRRHRHHWREGRVIGPRQKRKMKWGRCVNNNAERKTKRTHAIQIKSTLTHTHTRANCIWFGNTPTHYNSYTTDMEEKEDSWTFLPILVVTTRYKQIYFCSKTKYHQINYFKRCKVYSPKTFSVLHRWKQTLTNVTTQTRR